MSSYLLFILFLCHLFLCSFVQGDNALAVITVDWDVSQLLDGVYEIGLRVTCNEHSYVSSITSAIFDRTAPAAREALTKPSTRYAGFDSEISTTFTEPVDCNTVTTVVFSNGGLVADTEYTLLCDGAVVGIDFSSSQVLLHSVG